MHDKNLKYRTNLCVDRESVCVCKRKRISSHHNILKHIKKKVKVKQKKRAIQNASEEQFVELIVQVYRRLTARTLRIEVGALPGRPVTRHAGAAAVL